MDKIIKQESLLSAEWGIVGSLLLVMAALILIAKVQVVRDSERISENPLPSHEKCFVEIRGEVAKPGIYKAAPGTELKKILRKSSPTPYANLRNIDEESRIEESAIIHIDKLEEIAVTVLGVGSEPISLFLPPGARMCDLKSYVPEDILRQTQIFKSRRFLRDQETIAISKEIQK